MKIQELKIYTADLSKQMDFYANILGLPLVEKGESEAAFQIGRSLLRLKESDKFQPYHFAINIPSHAEEHALDWLKSRVKVLKEGEKEIQNFDSWNARAIYFYDQDNNIVELIARKNLQYQSMGPFNEDSLLEISEIGVPVNDIKSAYQQLTTIVELEKYDGDYEKFCAIGDEHGLFICINKQSKDWFPTGDKAYSSEFEIKMSEKGIAHTIQFKNERFKG
ncbi:VOC family protein [Flagellimonas crocea]|uniref:VOC family protein n=1 Tax=Flagellimonas crocea TaxID=3067311 RepID=UPI00296EE95E|nr:VOC family protein [Muricauda sp. DH64]